MRDVITVGPALAGSLHQDKVLTVGGRFIVIRAASAPFQCRISHTGTGKDWSETFDFKESDEFLVPDKLPDFNKVTLLNTSSTDDLVVEISIQTLPFRAGDERIPPTTATPSGNKIIQPADYSAEFDGIKSSGRRRQWMYVTLISVGKIIIYNDGQQCGTVCCTSVDAPGYFPPIASDGNFKFYNFSAAPVTIQVLEIFAK